jgi:predicted NAD/FAD-dependent oxidoreductase
MIQGRIAVIGAGIAGLACARRLVDAGLDPIVIDKGRAPGGRLATRVLTLAEGEIHIDHGAQYFTAREPGFQRQCVSWLASGIIEPWTATQHAAEPRYVGRPGMSAIGKAMAGGIEIMQGNRVTALTRQGGSWHLAFEDGTGLDGLTAIVLAIPPAQAATLLETVAPALAEEARSAKLAPCWAGIFAFDPPGEPGFQALRIADGGALGWIARSRDGPAWIAHATPDWSRRHLDSDVAELAPLMEAAIRTYLPDAGETRYIRLHRWRYALVEHAAGTPFVWDAHLQIGLCGDWRLGARVECAWESGDALGHALVQTSL